MKTLGEILAERVGFTSRCGEVHCSGYRYSSVRVRMPLPVGEMRGRGVKIACATRAGM